MVASTVITDIDVKLVSIPLEKPLLTAAFPIPAIDTALVEIHTRGGASGVAWSFAFGRAKVASLIGLIRDLSGIIVGEDASMVRDLRERLLRSVGFVGRRGLAAEAISTLDTGCWDIIGKSAGLPIYKILGGSRNAIETYASQGLWLDRDRDQLADEARKLIDSGFRAVKMRAGIEDEDEDIERVRAVRDAIGPNSKLMIDVNQAWNLKQTLKMAGKLEQFDIFWLEEPMPFEGSHQYGIATKEIPMMLCTGESNYFSDEIVRLTTDHMADIVMPDLMRMGGVTGWLEAVSATNVLQGTVTPHLFMEHSSQLAAASPNVVWQEYQPWWQPIMRYPIDFEDGKIILPQRPGFGIELDPIAVSRFEVKE